MDRYVCEQDSWAAICAGLYVENPVIIYPKLRIREVMEIHSILPFLEDDKTRIIQATIKRGNLDEVKLLVENGFILPHDSMTFAAQHGHLDILKYLYGRDLPSNRVKETAIHLSNLEIMDWAVENSLEDPSRHVHIYRISKDFKEFYKKYPHRVSVEYDVAKSNSVEIPISLNLHNLFYASIDEGNYKLFKHLFRHLDLCGDEIYNAMLSAADMDDLRVVKVLATKRGLADVIDKFVFNENIKAVRYCQKHGALIDTYLLNEAAYGNDIKMFNYLLSNINSASISLYCVVRSKKMLTTIEELTQINSVVYDTMATYMVVTDFILNIEWAIKYGFSMRQMCNAAVMKDQPDVLHKCREYCHKNFSELSQTAIDMGKDRCLRYLLQFGEPTFNVKIVYNINTKFDIIKLLYPRFEIREVMFDNARKRRNTAYLQWLHFIASQ